MSYRSRLRPRGPPTMTPRRSSRARSSQQPPAPPGPSHTPSSASTSSNGKGERAARSNNRTASPRDSPDEETSQQQEQIAPRRSRRGNADLTDKDIKKREDDEDEIVDDAAQAPEEEVTRCICGQAEYPGPSATVREQHAGQGMYIHQSWPSWLTCLESIPDDVGNFFVQCDSCHVWQHGGCMGLTDESMLPDEYYCELCKPQFHKDIRGPNG